MQDRSSQVKISPCSFWKSSGYHINSEDKYVFYFCLHTVSNQNPCVQHTYAQGSIHLGFPTSVFTDVHYLKHT